jgi:uncharacterized SAM-binding protein YcdF (DUF218 family)
MRGLFRFLRILSIVAAIAVVFVLVTYFSIPMSDTQQQSFDVILVLGNPANDDGTIATVGRSRVLEGIRQYRAGVAPRLLMTGGAVKNQFAEGDVMRQFAISQGVPADAVFAETQSRNTIQNAFYSYRIMQAHHWTSVLVVSSPTHIRRASLIFRHYPIAWKVQEAPWPPGLPLWRKAWLWSSESAYTSYVRVFGFPNAGSFLPKASATRF